MRNPAIHPHRPLWRHPALPRVLAAALAVLALTVACSITSGGATSSSESAIAKEAEDLEAGEVPTLALIAVEDIWEILSTRHIDQDTIDPKELTRSAVQALVDAADISELEDGDAPPSALERPEHVPEELAPLWDAWAAVFQEHNSAASPLDPVALSRAVFGGLIDAVDDPHAAYVPPQRYRLDDLDFVGTYQGVGAEVHSDEGAFILTPFSDSPAEKAGLLPGDRLLTVNGESVEGWTTLDVVSRVRGPKGTTVVLGVVHQGETEPVEVSVTRGDIDQVSVTWRETPSGHAYVRISGFYGNTDEALEDALKEIRGTSARGLIVDVRNNPGGLLTTTVNVASHFLDGGLVVYEVDGSGERKDWNAEEGGIATDLPLVLLVNQFSASAGEVLAGALQDRGRATVVGVTTFGKGSVNQLAALSDGGGLYYSYGRWYTPNGRLIEGSGIEPDIEVARGPIQRDDQMLRALDLIAEMAPPEA